MRQLVELFDDFSTYLLPQAVTCLVSALPEELWEI